MSMRSRNIPCSPFKLKGGKSRSIFFRSADEADKNENNEAAEEAEAQENELSALFDSAEDCVTFDNLGLIGAGSFGDVFKVRDPQTLQMFAMKRSKDGLKTEIALNDALCEVEIMRKLNALGICEGHDDDEKEFEVEVDDERNININICRFERHWIDADGRLCQLFEFCEHGTLRQLIDGNDCAFTALQTVQCVRQICKGLERVHSAHILHLDLKPENVLVDAERVLKICDFGISIDTEHRGEGDGARKFRCSGDPLYIAPEVLRSLNHALTDDINEGTDVFSLGVMAFEMLCGVELKKMKKKDERIRQIRDGEVDFEGVIADKPSNSNRNRKAKVDSESEEWAAVEAIRALCRRMLRKASLSRPSAREVRRDIDGVVSEHRLSERMRGIRALSVFPPNQNLNSSPPRTSARSKSSSRTATPSMSRTPSSAARREANRREQRHFAETPVRNHADAQRSKQNERKMRIRKSSAPSLLLCFGASDENSNSERSSSPSNASVSPSKSHFGSVCEVASPEMFLDDDALECSGNSNGNGLEWDSNSDSAAHRGRDLMASIMGTPSSPQTENENASASRRLRLEFVSDAESDSEPPRPTPNVLTSILEESAEFAVKEPNDCAASNSSESLFVAEHIDLAPSQFQTPQRRPRHRPQRTRSADRAKFETPTTAPRPDRNRAQSTDRARREGFGRREAKRRRMDIDENAERSRNVMSSIMEIEVDDDEDEGEEDLKGFERERF